MGLEAFVDRDLNAHISSMSGVHYGVILYSSQDLRDDLRDRLGIDFVKWPEMLSFSGRLDDCTFEKLRKYTFENDVDVKVFKGECGHFVDDDPAEWEERYC